MRQCRGRTPSSASVLLLTSVVGFSGQEVRPAWPAQLGCRFVEITRHQIALEARHVVEIARTVNVWTTVNMGDITDHASLPLTAMSAREFSVGDEDLQATVFGHVASATQRCAHRDLGPKR